MSRRVSLPTADDLFRGNRPDDGGPATSPRPSGRAPPSAPPRKPSGRVRHDEKMTVYVTADELLDIEHARLSLRRHQGLAVDRGRLVREAIAIALADLEANGDDSVLVQRLTGAMTDLAVAPEEVATPRRPRRARGFAVRLDNFEGPFDLLLSLISKHKLDVTEVALSQVTDEFIAHIKAAGEVWDLEQTTSFLLVASTLLDLKAARLLPQGDVEDEEDLALLEARDLLFARLLQYKAFKQVAGILDRRMTEEARRHPRSVGLEERFATLLPEVLIGLGLEEFAGLAARRWSPSRSPRASAWATSTPRPSACASRPRSSSAGSRAAAR